MALAVLLRGLLDHSRTIIAHHTASRVQEDLRGKLYDKIAELGPAWFAGERTGGVMLSLVDGVEQLQSFFGQYLPQVCVAALTPIAIFAFIVWWDLPVATVMLLQAQEGLSDREACDRLAFDLRWKAAAGLPVGSGSFHPTVLVGMRNRLRASERPRRLFEDVLSSCGGISRSRP